MTLKKGYALKGENKMKKSRLLTLFTLTNFLAILFFIIYVLPETVVFRFSLTDMKAVGFVGKWYNIIMPSLAVITCIVILLIDIREDGTKKHVFRYIISYLAICVCFFFTWVMMGIQVHLTHVTDNSITIPWTIIILLPIAYFMFINGVAERSREHGESSIFGFAWVKSNLIVWQKTHKVAGVLSILVAISLCVIAVLNETIFHSDWCYVIAAGVWFVVYFVGTMAYSMAIEGKYNR